MTTDTLAFFVLIQSQGSRLGIGESYLDDGREAFGESGADIVEAVFQLLVSTKRGHRQKLVHANVSDQVSEL